MAYTQSTSDADHLAEVIIREVVTSLLLQYQQHAAQFAMLLSALPSFEQKNFTYTFLKLVSKDYLSSIITSDDDSCWWESDAELVSAASGLIKLVSAQEACRNHLMTWFTSSSGAGVGDGIAIRRAVIAALAPDTSFVEKLLEKILGQFGDQLYIRHTPTMQQEGRSTFCL